MAGGVNRDVVINLVLTPGRGNSTVAKQVASEIEKATKEATKKTEELLKSTKKASSDAAKSEVKDTKLVMTEAIASRKKMGAVAEDWAKQQSSLAKKAADSEIKESQRKTDTIIRNLRMQGQAHGRANKKLLAAESELNAQVSEFQMFSLERFKGFSAGAITAAEGLTMLGIVSQENAEQIAKYFVTVKSGFNVIAGSIDMFVNYRQAVLALTRVKKAELAVNEALIATDKARALSSALATGGGKGGVGKAVAAVGTQAAAGAATKAAGGAVAGNLAGGVAGAFGFAGIGSAAKGLAVGLGGVAKAAGVVAAKFALIFAAADALQAGFKKLLGFTGSSIIMETLGLFKDRAAAADSEEKTKKMEEQRDKRRAEVDRRNQEVVKTASFNASRRSESRAALQTRISLGGGSDVDKSNKLISADYEELKAAEKELADAREKAEQRKRAGQAAIISEELAAIERVKTARANLIQTETQRLQLLKQQGEEAKNNVKTARDELKASREKIEAEENAFQSKLAKFGQLNKAQQEELKAITDKIKAGKEISEREAQTLNSLGFGQKQAQNRFAKSGAQAGGADVLAVLGENDNLNKAKEEAALKAKIFEQREAQLAATQGAIGQAQASVQKSAGAAGADFAASQKSKSDQAGIETAESVYEKASGDLNSGGEELKLAINNMGQAYVDQIKQIKEEIEVMTEQIASNKR